MAEDITDAQVLAQLYRRKAKLSIELKKVNLAIEGLLEIDENELEELDILPYSIEQSADDIAIATLLYNPKDSIEKKILYALSKIGKGDVAKITQFLCSIDPSVKDAKVLFDSVTYRSSRMSRFGRLESEKDGKKNVYSLKKIG